ncbi:3-hydroxyacyl-CoA dehydrogenase NAD-binding domain-containing protein [Aureispira anguillae]|uniref:3-hydroxyacyl-CoA dehydrogenase NAD-binding domain-containing protein n=1 Tax=Aureispira anguillae TaxID=2864201 RepID=A0A915YDK5_9BACT|nr:3-hydroxyacyl-CoA dehydrogenase NAD-binding domain-containing protein [Aureispira anguillae]BDS11088.1 3-hydroxyacyl-CoA dehydrogenase NAD-binding domain-containing protein [Aureispira anguillae]
MKVGVLGAGSMGIGIAQIAATFGHEVVLCDNNAAAMEQSIQRLTKILLRLVEKGRISQSDADGLVGRIQTTSMINEFNDCDIVIEAIIENLDIKKSVFQKMEDVVSSQCILATNTSSLSVASIAAACQKPERVIGIHFFNPAPLMKLVEIIPAIQTSESVLEQSRALIDSWKKVTVLAKDTPGFIVNRVARPFYGESLRILEEGIADVATIDWAMTELAGFRMGPFTLMDYIGNDVNYVVTETVFTAFYYDPRYKPAFTQKRLSEAGYYGRKSGRGYYNYAEGATNPAPTEDQALGQKIVDRVVVMLINEAADALFWNVASAQDIDLAMTKGVNYPKGLLEWAKEIGYQNCVDRLDALYNEYHEDRYRCSPMLRKLAKEN